VLDEEEPSDNGVLAVVEIENDADNNSLTDPVWLETDALGRSSVLGGDQQTIDAVSEIEEIDA